MESLTLKSAYVHAARATRSACSRAHVLPALDQWAGRSRNGVWARSLLAVYDIGDLSALDVPWWTFESAALVDAFLRGRRDARVFEWGSGASTVWLARRSASVVAVEHDERWAGEVRARLPEGAPVDLRVVPAEEAAAGAAGEARSSKPGATELDFRAYVDVIDEVGGTFDVIVIDGRARQACLASAVDHLAPDGIIVFDNVERARYRQAIAAIRPAMEVSWTHGLTPCLPYPTRTAILRPSLTG
ncbi:MAG: class I SAM-dependent methyltransferase [Candidatus Nanopelagicales bacterium]